MQKRLSACALNKTISFLKPYQTESDSKEGSGYSAIILVWATK